jgi:predicted dithiol-disulfide oxidoreductase (DUF899 family)
MAEAAAGADGEREAVHDQLFIKHFMMEPGQEWQREGCSLESDHVDGLLPHFEHHDMRM